MSDEENTARFKAYFRAYRRLSSFGLSFQYGTLANFIVIPDGYGAAAGIFEHVHEQAHAQLSNTVLGLTLQVVSKLAGKVQEAIFFRLSPILYSLEASEPMLRRDLYLYGRPFDWKGKELPESVRRHHEKIREAPGFAADVALFRRLNSRERAISSKWRPVQEGMAILNACTAAAGTSDCALPFLRQAMRHWRPSAGLPERRILREQLRKLGEETVDRHTSLGWNASDSTKGYLLAAEALSKCGSVSRVWLMALFASHFPYHRCRLVDMDDAEFDRLVEHGYLNPWRRFAALLDNAELVTRAYTDPNLVRQLLKILDPEHELEPLRPEAASFGRWKRDYLWGSDLFTSFIGVPVEEQLSPQLRHLLDSPDEDRRNEVRMWSRNDPTVVTEDGDMFSETPDHEAAFINNFIHWYEIFRTERILRWLEETSH